MKTGPTLYWLVVFVCTSLLHIALSLQSQRSVLYESTLPLRLRIGVLATEIIYLAVAIGCIAVFHQRVLRPLLVASGKPAVHRIAVFLLTWLLLIAYLSSWGTFAIIGVFIDLDALRMFANDPVQIFQHAAQLSSPLVLALLLLSLLLAGVLSIWLVRAVPVLKANARQAVFLFGFLVVAVAAGGVLQAGVLLRGGSAADLTRVAGADYNLAELYRAAKKTTAGPLSSLSAALLDVALGQGKTALAVPLDSIDWKPRIGMQDYLRGVDRSRLERKNVLVILIESLRRDQLPVYHGRAGVMPALNELAGQSLVFDNAYAQSSHSNYADPGPLSSQYPLRSADMYFYPEDPAYPRVMLYDILHELGYRTAIFSSQNEHWGGMLNFFDTGGLDRVHHAGNYSGELTQSRIEGGWSKLLIGDKPSGKVDDRVTVQDAIRWIASAPGRPFFMYMNLQTSHLPYDVPAGFPRRFVTDPRRLPVYLGTAEMQVESEEQLKDLYADSLFYIDTQLDALFGYLREQSLLEKTIVVVSADTGTAFLEHGMNGNGADLYNEVVKVPLFIHAPGLEPGVSSRLVQHIDVPPSVLGLLGLPAHPAFQGSSVFASPADSGGPAFLVSQTPLTRQYAIVDERWKLIIDVRRGRRFLYDLTADPGEQHDVLREHPQVEQALSRRLQAWIGLQLTYYEDVALQQRYYPPVE